MQAVLTTIGFLFIFIAGFSNAATPTYLEGKEFTLLAEPIRTTDLSKIEIAEAFAYPCHACFNF